MFGIPAECLASFLLENGLVKILVKEAGVPGFPGCREHSSMIWHAIQDAKRQKGNSSVVWLDLGTAYESVPHVLIEFAMFFSGPLAK